jgi:hypothetical protein
MNKFLVFLIALVAVAGCGTPSTDAPAGTTGASTSSQTPAKPEDALVGTWKVDMAKSVLEGLTDKEKEEGTSVELDIKADGTFTGKSAKETAKDGTWTLKDKKVTFTGTSLVPPEMTLADDGKSMSTSMEEGGKTVTLVLSKS